MLIDSLKYTMFFLMCLYITIITSCKPEDPVILVDNNKDSDGDGILDSQEISDGTDPYDPCDPPQSIDYTGYDISNNIWYEADCDGDLASNGEEVKYGFNPYKKEVYFPLSIGNYWKYEYFSSNFSGDQTYDPETDRFFYSTLIREGIQTNDVIDKKIIDDKEYFVLKQTIGYTKFEEHRIYSDGENIVILRTLPENKIDLFYWRLGEGNTKIFDEKNDIIQNFIDSSEIVKIESKNVFGVVEECITYLKDKIYPWLFISYKKSSYLNTIGLIESEQRHAESWSSRTSIYLIECEINGLFYSK